MYNAYESWKEHAVEADSIEEFLDKYHKHKSYYGRGEEYAQSLLKSYKEEFEKNGYVITPRGDSVTGEVVAWYGRKENAK